MYVLAGALGVGGIFIEAIALNEIIPADPPGGDTAPTNGGLAILPPGSITVTGGSSCCCLAAAVAAAVEVFLTLLLARVGGVAGPMVDGLVREGSLERGSRSQSMS